MDDPYEDLWDDVETDIDNLELTDYLDLDAETELACLEQTDYLDLDAETLEKKLKKDIYLKPEASKNLGRNSYLPSRYP